MNNKKIKNFLAVIMIIKFAVSIFLLFKIPILGVIGLILNIVLFYIFDDYNFHKRRRKKKK